MSRSNINQPSISEQIGEAEIPIISQIPYFNNSKYKDVFIAINRKIDHYNELVQSQDEKDKNLALLLLQEIDYSANFLMNHEDSKLSGPGKIWYLTSGIAQQFLRFEKPLSQGLAAQAHFYALSHQSSENDGHPDFSLLLKEAKSAGIDAASMDLLKSKLLSAPYQNSAAAIRDHAILQQLKKTTLHTLMTADEQQTAALQTLLIKINSHLHALIQAEPSLQHKYSLHEQYASDFDILYDTNKKNAMDFMRALANVHTHLLNADDDTIIEYYKNNPASGIIAYKSADAEQANAESAGVKGIRMSIDALKADWVRQGIKTFAELSALAPALMDNNDLKFLAAGNNITWRLQNKDSGDYLILRVTKTPLTNPDSIETLKDTPAGAYFAEEYATFVGSVNTKDNIENYTLTVIEYCPGGNLQHLRKSISEAEPVLIQKQACDALSPFMGFCTKLIDENAYLTDIKLSNVLVGSKISDLKSVRCCAKDSELHHLNRNEATGDITPWYAPPEWDVNYVLVACSPLPDRHEQKLGEIYYDTTTHEYSVLGHDRKIYTGKDEALGDKKTREKAINLIKNKIPFDMDKFMSYQLGLSLYDFITGLTIVLEGENSADRNQSREIALQQLLNFKATGLFDYSHPAFQGAEGQALQTLCSAMLNTNPEERISVKEAVARLEAIKAQVHLSYSIQRYKEHNEKFHTDPDFLKQYQLLQTFAQEIREAQSVSKNEAFFTHALQEQTYALEAWIRQAESNPQKKTPFYAHYCKSLLINQSQSYIDTCGHRLAALSAGLKENDAMLVEKQELLEKISQITLSLEDTMRDFLSEHRNNVAITPTVEFAKIFEASSAMGTYISALKTHFEDLESDDFRQMRIDLSRLSESLSTENVTEALRKETLYLQYRVSSEQKDQEQEEPLYLRELRKALVFHCLDRNQLTDNSTENLTDYLATLFKTEGSNDPKKDLLWHAQQYEEQFAKGKYDTAYTEALKINKQVTNIYTTLMGDESNDPLVRQMAQLREDMTTAYNTGAVSAKISAETLQKVNLELTHAISYVAGPKLSTFKPVHSNDEWAQIKKDNDNANSPTKKWSNRILMGIGMTLAFVLVTGTGGVAALPSITAQIAATVSPSVASSAINSITLSSIVNRAKVVFSDKQKAKHSARVFDAALAVQSNLEQKIGDTSRHAPMLAPNQSGLFHHHAPAEVAKEPKDSEGESDAGGHIRPKE